MIYSIARNSFSAIYSTIKDVVDYSSTTIYDMFISHPITSLTYEKLCERLTGQQQRILDVGVGTGVPLNQALNRFPINCEITAIDINHNYLRKATQLFKDKPQVKLYELDFYQMNSETYGTFDAIVFSSSFLLLNQPKEALQLAISLLKPGGNIYFMVTLSDSHFGDTLKYITSIDLHLQSEKEFEQMIQQSQLKINYKQRLQKVTNIATLLFKVIIYETKI
ncbi:unnamed protein product (macronuclear) [Paramecium tetraurelia]|uniref:Methyltransferase domain-containing protein n=1 Tax=Paramecium tetraurelia TaxID=5888 RepID=A0D4R8_PARTE|nr:uncharacterized protein GSPATT00013482001 [Paramecium tetraurelia]CAK78035.1 unnamed protein product [Paramecium tetraurelia]|eukprot:XP_001445432.1 hypothetical protein (macronuclear) [Paramecium tetraurelia strain d4-2]